MAAEGITGGERVTRVSWRDAAAGGVGAIVCIAATFALGLLAFASVGTSAAMVGIPAAFIATIIGGLVFAVRAHSVMPVASPTTATALIVAGIVAELAADPSVLLNEPDGIAQIVCVVSISVIGMGLAQIAFALLRLGPFAKFIPHPVIAGFMTGLATLIVLSQLPLLLGVPPFPSRTGPAALLGAHPVAIAVALATAAVVWITAWRSRRAPGALLGLIAGTVADALLRYGSSGIASSDLAGFIPAYFPLPIALAPLAGADTLDIVIRHWPSVGAASLLLAIVGSIESMRGARATDEQANRQHDANGDLFAIGLGNVASGLFGGLPVSYSRVHANAILDAGGRTWRAAAISAAASGILFMLGARLFALLPLAVLAGLVLTLAVGVIDRWTRQLLFQRAFRTRTRDTWTSLAMLAAICGITLWLGLAAGAAASVLVSMLVFMNTMNRSLVRSRYTALAQPSRRVYSRAQEDELRPLRAQITIVNLEGALFFGNVDRLQHRCEALPHGTRFVIVDLSRVTMIDATGARALTQLGDRLAGRSVRLLLSGISTGNRHGRTLLALGAEMYDSTRRWFPDVDHAVEAAERGLLGSTLAATTVATVPFEQSALVAGLSSKQIEVVRKHTRLRILTAHETLFHEGDPGDGLFVLTRGSVSMLYRGDGNGARHQRYVSFSPGMMFGEVALLDRAGRTADAVADVESIVHELTRERLDALRGLDPELGAKLYANIATHLAERLHIAAGAWSASVR